MKILFLRHGEAMDDINNTFGGWSDDTLTENGQSQILEKSKSIKELNINFEIVFHSPLKRTMETAEILGKSLNIPTAELPEAIEFGGLGVLTGINKEEAKVKYPKEIELLSKTNEL